MKLSNKQLMLIIGVVCTLPIVASYLMYFFGPTRKGMNYGELIAAQPLPAHRLIGLDGRPFSLGDLRGKWIMIRFDASSCDERCRRELYYMRQVRTAQGPEMDRIERVWLLTDNGMPSEAVQRDFAGTLFVRLTDPTLAASFPAGADRAAHIYLVDPLGNLMLRYPENPDPKKIIKDFERLLKYSRIG
jgi:cytochrome oxidase Cu insertion factor (SCO1/SenC/PrrC family)